MDNSKNEELKVIFLGETFVGKTCLIKAYLENNFKDKIDSTISASSFIKKIETEKGKYTLRIWDTAGQEQYRCLNKIFIKDSQIVIFVYDITRKKTLEELNYWYEYSENCLGKGNAVYAVLANKIDLFDKENEIKEEYDELGLKIEYVNVNEGKDFAEKIEALFCETSAKELMTGFSELMIKLVETYYTKNQIVKSKTFKIEKQGLKKKKIKIC